MVRSIDGVILRFKSPKYPGDTDLNPSKTESIFNLQRQIDQLLMSDVLIRPLKWQTFLLFGK